MSSDDPESITALPAGARFGAYEVVRVLGTGAFGTVYEALRHPLRKRVALKVLHADMARNPETLARFLREAEAASQLDHPHIVDVQDLGAIDGSSFITMEYLEGETLDARIDRVTRLSVEATLDVMLPILSAVAAVHARGIIHRDIKPANMFLTPGPQGDFPRLLDFGIAKDTTTNISLTRAASVLGTPSYMSPQQVREGRFIDSRTDIWALGVVLHECVTGYRPFEGESVFETFEQIMRGPIVAPGATVAGVDPGFDAVVLKALQRDPDARYSSVRSLAADLLPFASPNAQAAWSREFARPEGARPSAPPIQAAGRASPRAPEPVTLAAPSLPVAPPPSSVRPIRPIVLVAGVLTTALIVLAALVSLRGRDPRPSAPAPVVRGNPTRAPSPPPTPAPVVDPVVEPVPLTTPEPVPAPAIAARPATAVLRPIPHAHSPVRPPVHPTARPNPLVTPPGGIGNY